jgi:glycosyltransferase involved in cell wall biosynthesis
MNRYEESLKYLSSLRIPEGYEVEVVAAENLNGLAASYNQVMNNSDAKYKVYMEEEALIINKNFLFELLDVFKHNAKLGMVGLIGGQLSQNPKGDILANQYGEIYKNIDKKMSLVSYAEVEGSYTEVQAIQGPLIATQFDMPWRDDLFKGADMLALSQSLEYHKKGYEVGVVSQDSPWCLYDKQEVNQVMEQQEFLSEYSKGLYPLVSVLIPTYNRPHYFELALQSVLQQTYKNIEIIVCDDSTNDETFKLIHPYLIKYNHIRYYKNEVNLGQFDNDIQCMELAKGEYVNFLMDDDLFHPTKIEKMMKYFMEDTEQTITLVTSHRQLIDSDGKHSGELQATARIFEQDTTMDGIEAGEFMLSNVLNFIGEPTTALFRKNDLEEPFGCFGGRQYICNVDMASWGDLLAKGKLVYIAETLSYYRKHGEQQLQSKKMLIGGLCDLAHQVLKSPQRGFFADLNKYEMAIKTALRYFDQIEGQLDDEDRTEQLYATSRMFHRLLNKKLDEINELIKQQQPLVSVLIPAYNRPHYLELALRSVLNQTYRNIEIIICDDSSNDEVERMLQPYLSRYNHISYYKNEHNLLLGNFYKCYDLSSGEYINYLMDDDLFHPQKIEKMVKYLAGYKEVTLVTSQRILIDEDGNELEMTGVTKKMFSSDTIINGEDMGDYILKNTINIVGEPSSVIFRRKDLTERFGWFFNREYSVINDLATWISLLSKGKMVYIAEGLSYFRQHRGQNQKNPRFFHSNINEWFNLLYDSRKKGFLRNERDFKFALRKYITIASEVIDFYNDIGKLEILEHQNAHDVITKAINDLVTYKDFYYCTFCNNRFSSMMPWPDQHDSGYHRYEMFNKLTAICPSCHSLDRERLYKYFLEIETDILISELNILHVAPEKNLRALINQNKRVKYVCGDLYPTDEEMIKLDITNIEFPDNIFDVILCSHVLEHIPDDKLAMRELYRVLKPGGWGILQVPIALDLIETYEDFSIITPEEKFIAFGQDDHVRIYAKDYVDRLRSVGFLVEIYNYADKLGVEQALRIGLSETDNLYIVRKL